MDKNWITRKSFLFGSVDMFQQFGVFLEAPPERVLLPGLRPQKAIIPQRHGAYDYGAKYYDEQRLRLKCATIRTLQTADTREIAYVISRKSEIRIWDEPEKYYIGRIYDETALEQLRNTANRFVLTLICEPFAYGQTVTKPFSGLNYAPEYPGTAETPTYIEIVNTGSQPVTNIRITQIDKRNNY